MDYFMHPCSDTFITYFEEYRFVFSSVFDKFQIIQNPHKSKESLNPDYYYLNNCSDHKYLINMFYLFYFTLF